MVEGAREVCGLVRVGEKSPKSVWWNDEIKDAIRRKEAAWKGLLAAAMKRQKNNVWKRTEKRRERDLL